MRRLSVQLAALVLMPPLDGAYLKAAELSRVVSDLNSDLRIIATRASST